MTPELPPQPPEPPLTTEAGTPVIDNQRSRTAGPAGPTLLQDHPLIEKMFSRVGKRTDLLLRFSTVAGSKGFADTARDLRGFAVKFYAEDGNWDLVGNNTPIRFIRDGIKFPDFIHSQKPDPFSGSRGSSAIAASYRQ